MRLATHPLRCETGSSAMMKRGPEEKGFALGPLDAYRDRFSVVFSDCHLFGRLLGLAPRSSSAPRGTT
jgi:hypothetical protein